MVWYMISLPSGKGINKSGELEDKRARERNTLLPPSIHASSVRVPAAHGRNNSNTIHTWEKETLPLGLIEK